MFSLCMTEAGAEMQENRQTRHEPDVALSQVCWSPSDLARYSKQSAVLSMSRDDRNVGTFGTNFSHHRQDLCRLAESCRQSERVLL